MWLLVSLALAQDLVVSNLADSGSGTLRDALTQAAGTFGPETIVFMTGDGRIDLLSPLPAIGDEVEIRGVDPSACAPGGTAHDLSITVAAAASFPANEPLMRVTDGGALSLRGLAFTDFPHTGLRIEGDTSKTHIQCSWFGLDAHGTPSSTSGGAAAIRLAPLGDTYPEGLVIGSDGDGLDDAVEHNVIAAVGFGVWFTGTEPTQPSNDGIGVAISGNFFGTAPDGGLTADAAFQVGDGVAATVPWTGLQIGGRCGDAPVPHTGNVFGRTTGRMLDLHTDHGLHSLCIDDNDFGRTPDGDPFDNDFLLGVFLQGDHDDAEITRNRFARRSTAIVARGLPLEVVEGQPATGVYAGDLPERLHIHGNTFGDPYDVDLGVQRALSLQLLGGVTVEDNMFYGGLDDAGIDGIEQWIGSGMVISGAEVMVRGNTFTDTPNDASVRVRPYAGNPDVHVRNDDVLSLVTLESNTFDNVRLALSLADQPLPSTLASVHANNVVVNSPTGVVAAHLWRVLPAYDGVPAGPVPWTYATSDPALLDVVSRPPVLMRTLDDAAGPDFVGTYLGNSTNDQATDLETWPEVLETVLDTQGTAHPVDVSACGVSYVADQGLSSDWTRTHDLLQTSSKGAPYERYHTFDLGNADCACGNGFLEVGETCDDGNAAGGDGCSSDCLVEDGFQCASVPITATGQSPNGATLLHGADPASWSVDSGATTLHDPLHCGAPELWTAGMLAPSLWLVGSLGTDDCDRFLPEGTTTFVHDLELEPRHRTGPQLSLWVAVEDGLASIHRADTEVVVFDPPLRNFSSVRTVQLPTDALVPGAGPLSFAVENAEGSGGMMVLPGPSVCGGDGDDDGVADFGDADSDDDGIADVREGSGLDPSGDHDADGVSNAFDADVAGFVDGDSNGVDDRVDLDGDGLPNHLDLDSDGDGRFDAEEAGWPTAVDGRVDSADTDGDGTLDAVELPGAETDATRQEVQERTWVSDPYDANDPWVATGLTGHTAHTGLLGPTGGTGRTSPNPTADTGTPSPTDAPSRADAGRAPGFACQIAPPSAGGLLLGLGLLALRRRRLAP